MKKTLLILVLFPKIILAQVDSLKFEIIRQSIVFLATDNKTVDEVGEKPICIYPDYACLKNFCDEKTTNDEELRIRGGSEKIDEWSKINCQSVNDLTKLSKLIQDQLTNGQSKVYRKALDSYQQYVDVVSQMTNNAKDDEPAAIKAPPEKEQGDTTTVNTDGNGKNNKNGKQGNAFPIGTAAAIAALLLSGYAVYNLSNKASKKSVSNIRTELLDRFREEIAKMGKPDDLSKKPGLDPLLAEKFKELEGQMAQIEKRSASTVQNVKEKVIVPPTLPPELSVKRFFAKLPDLDNGFSKAILSDTQNGELIYELTVKGDKGTYTISTEPGVQKYALSDTAYYLSNACILLNQPVKNCTIVPSGTGTVKLSSGNWMIEEKIKIEFKQS